MNPSVADVAYAMLIVNNVRIYAEKDGTIAYSQELAAESNLAAAADIVNACSSEMIHLGRWLIQFPFENLPASKRLKAYRRYREALPKAESPLHAKQKAMEQVTAKPIKQLKDENWFSK